MPRSVKTDFRSKGDWGMDKVTPHPGSDDAVSQGCTCPVLDNGHGRGVLGKGEEFGWWIDELCPLHGGIIMPKLKQEEGSDAATETG